MGINPSPSRRRAIALISGGKDSILASHLAQVVLGYDIAAFAHLKPRQERNQEKADETDSYMFQSVGSDAVDSLGESILESSTVRYYSAEILGSSVCIDAEYVQDEHDEVEDLRRMLQMIVDELTCDDSSTNVAEYVVVSGAIWSRYQKRRVEIVCRDLGLRSVSPLWSLDQNLYLLQLRRMKDEFESILIKTACLGLGRRHLLKSFADDGLVRDLIRLYNQYEINVGGEGGEYETFTTRAPGYRLGGLQLNGPAECIQPDSDTSYARFAVSTRNDGPNTSFAQMAAESTYLTRIRNFWTSGQLDLIEAGFPLHVDEAVGSTTFDKLSTVATPWLALRHVQVSQTISESGTQVVHFQQFGKQGYLTQSDITLEFTESECMAFRTSSEIGLLRRIDGSIAIADILPGPHSSDSIYAQLISALRGLDNFLAATRSLVGDPVHMDPAYAGAASASTRGNAELQADWSVAGLLRTGRLVVGLPAGLVLGSDGSISEADAESWVQQLCVEYARRNPDPRLRRLNLFLRLKACDLIACPLCLENGADCSCQDAEFLESSFLVAPESGPSSVPHGAVTIRFDQPAFYVNIL